jgi:oxaloacetate decarboxylase gamma subunit
MYQALDLVLYGMSSVFVFLTVLVGATLLMSRLVNIVPVASDSEINSDPVDPRLLAAISAAVKQYRQTRL